MNTPPAESLVRSSRQGFTLVEVLVSSALVAGVMGMLFSVLMGVMNAFEGGTARLQTNGDARMALDMIARDLQSMVVRQTSTNQQWMVSYSRETDSTDAPGHANTWLTFFAPSIDRDPGQQGDIVAISYIVGFQDPIAVGNNDYFQLFGLYKTMASTQDTFTDALGQTDIISGFWNNPGEDLIPNGVPPKPDFLIPNVIKFDVAWWIRYDDDNDPNTPDVLLRVASESPVTLSNELMVNGGVVNGAIEAAEVSMVILDNEGMQQAQAFSRNGPLNEDRIDELIRLYGRVQTVKVPISY